MTAALTVAQARRWYAEDLRVAAPVVHDPRVVEAFAAVPRERHLGPGPWMLYSRTDLGRAFESPSRDPAHLYHDVLVTIDAGAAINNGLPSLWAMAFDHLGVAAGSTVLQVGAGVGYYTAVLAELAGPHGRVIAYEVEDALADRARTALAPYSQAEVRLGDATAVDDLPDLDVVVAFAGVTHAPDRFLDALVDGGRMVLPLTGADGLGLLMRLARAGDAFAFTSLGPCGFYPCAGARADAEAARLTEAFAARPLTHGATGTYRRGRPPVDGAQAWVVGETYWIEAG